MKKQKAENGKRKQASWFCEESKRVKDSSLESLYGAFISKQSADELISEIKKSRTFKSKRPSF